MSLICRTYSFRLKPSKVQQVLLDKHFGCVRYVYNHFLHARKEQYASSGTSDNYVQQAQGLCLLKRRQETIWLKEVNSQSLQFAVRSVDTAYKNFFSHRCRFPRFKPRKCKNSFTVPQHTFLIGNKIYVPKFNEGIPCILHRKVKGTVGRMTFSRTASGTYDERIVKFCIFDY